MALTWTVDMPMLKFSSVIRSYRYPLRPTKTEETVLVRYLGACAALYNGALQERRDAWRKLGKSIGYNDQCASLTEIRSTDPAWRDVPSVAARSALRRLDRAMQDFFRRCKAGQTPGFPRFRASRRYDSFGCGGVCPVRGGRVHLPKLGWVKFHEYRPLRGKVLDAIVRREAGKWFVIFQVDLGEAPPKVSVASIPAERAIGLDVGLRTLVTLSTGEAIPNPRHGAEGAAVLARRQRALARKRKGSKSRQRAAVHVHRAHLHVQNQRLDTARKIAAALVQRFDLIAYEDLAISQMVHGNLARSIHDAGWRILLHCIACKAEEAGGHAVAVDPRGTSQRCSGCGATNAKRKTLSERTHTCDNCGLVLDRDHNAALNILALGRSAARLSVTPPITTEGSTLALGAA